MPASSAEAWPAAVVSSPAWSAGRSTSDEGPADAVGSPLPVTSEVPGSGWTVSTGGATTPGGLPSDVTSVGGDTPPGGLPSVRGKTTGGGLAPPGGVTTAGGCSTIGDAAPETVSNTGPRTGPTTGALVTVSVAPETAFDTVPEGTGSEEGPV